MARVFAAFALLASQLVVSTAFLGSPKVAPQWIGSTPSSSRSSPSRRQGAMRLPLPHGVAQRRPRHDYMARLTPRHHTQQEQQQQQQPQQASLCRAHQQTESPGLSTSENPTCWPKKKPLVTPRFAALTASALAAGLAVAVLAPGPAAAAVKAIVAGSEDEVHLHVGQKVANFFRRGGLPDWATLMTISAMPVIELRGGVPVGIWMDMPIAKVFGLCVAGNMIPIPIILLALRSKFVQKLAKPVLDRAREKAAGFGDEKSQALALTLFVGIPLPGTGAWTGAMGAFLLGMPFQKASDVCDLLLVSAGESCLQTSCSLKKLLVSSAGRTVCGGSLRVLVP